MTNNLPRRLRISGNEQERGQWRESGLSKVNVVTICKPYRQFHSSPARQGLFQRQQREGREPVLAHIVAGDMGQAGVEMLGGRAPRELGQGRIERVGEGAPGPSPAG